MSEPQHKPSFWRSIRAVAWSMFGVRKGSEWREDFAQIKPLHILAVGVVAIFALVIALIVLVNWVV
ncbi:MAG: DUF2970 domain-containing protein [Comamonas sp.]